MSWLFLNEATSDITLIIRSLFCCIIFHVAHNDCMFLHDLKIAASCSPAVDFYFRSQAWEEQRKLYENLESASVDDTSHLDIGLIVFWQVGML